MYMYIVQNMTLARIVCDYMHARGSCDVSGVLCVSHQMQLLTRIRLARNFTDYKQRLKCVMARLHAVSILGMSALLPSPLSLPSLSPLSLSPPSSLFPLSHTYPLIYSILTSLYTYYTCCFLSFLLISHQTCTSYSDSLLLSPHTVYSIAPMDVVDPLIYDGLVEELVEVLEIRDPCLMV